MARASSSSPSHRSFVSIFPPLTRREKEAPLACPLCGLAQRGEMKHILLFKRSFEAFFPVLKCLICMHEKLLSSHSTRRGSPKCAMKWARLLQNHGKHLSAVYQDPLERGGRSPRRPTASRSSPRRASAFSQTRSPRSRRSKPPHNSPPSQTVSKGENSSSDDESSYFPARMPLIT